MFIDVIEVLLQKKEVVKTERAALDATEAKIDQLLILAGYEAYKKVQPEPTVAVEAAQETPIIDVEKLNRGLAVY